MNAFQIKILAIVTMIIDHVGLFFFPHIYIFRIIGRLSFPLFAWLIANGAQHTHNIGNYLTRLFLFAMIAQLPFLFANRLIDPYFSGLNVLCTLFFGLLAIAFIQRTDNWAKWLIITVLCSSMAELLQTDYGGLGVAMIVLFYVFFNNFEFLVLAQIVLFFIPFILFPQNFINLFDSLGLFSLIFIRFYNNQAGPSAKYLFYIFYPLQYVIYYLIFLKF